MNSLRPCAPIPDGGEVAPSTTLGGPRRSVRASESTFGQVQRLLLGTSLALAGVMAAEPDRAAKPPGPPAAVTWEKDIRPIFKAACFHCHGEEGKPKGGLDLRLARLTLKGGDSGPSVVPGKPAESELLEKIRSGAMPPEGKKLTPAQVSLVERWIAGGAKTLRAEPSSPEAVTFTEEDRTGICLNPPLRIAGISPRWRGC